MEFKKDYQKYSFDYYKVSSKHSRRLIKALELFSFNYLEALSANLNKYNNPYNELLYFDIDLLRVINDVLSLKLNQEQWI